MMAAFSNPPPSPDRPAPRVRLEVRTPAGQSLAHELPGDEFLIGGAAGCDLRLQSSAIPPVVCQITRKADGVRVRRVASGLPVLLNAVQLSVNSPTDLTNQDCLTIAGVEIVVAIQHANYMAPRLIPIAAEEELQPDADLFRRERELKAQAEELEVDRALWYRRRQEMERDLERGDDRDDLERREGELTQLRDELAALRERLAREFQEQRDQLAQTQERVRTETAALREEREAFAAERADETERLGSWEASLAGREGELRTERESFERDRLQLADDLLRLDRRRAEIEELDRDLTTRLHAGDARLDQLKRESAEWEETVGLAAAEQDRLHSEAERIDRQRLELDAQSARLAERAAQLDAQQSVLVVVRAKLDRTREEMEREAAALLAARVRDDEAQAELAERIREAEHLRAELSTVQESAVQRDSLLAAGLEEIRQQKEALAAEEARLREREAALDLRAAEFADQAGTLKGRVTQAFDLQARLEADRVAVREREAALAQAEEVRQALQDQLRRRAEELAGRSATLDEAARTLATDRAEVDRILASTEAARLAAEEQIAAQRLEVATRSAAADEQARTTAEREAELATQIVRLKELGQAMAAEREYMTDARVQWEADRIAAEEQGRIAREELEAFRARAAAEMDALRAQAPEMDERAKEAFDRLTAAKDVLRGHLAELHAFARQSREDLDAVRTQIGGESERLRDQEASLDRARAAHRLAVAAFRQQIVDWQSKVGEIKQALSRGETHLDSRQADIERAARQIDSTSQHLAEQAEQLRRDRAEVVQQRTEVERHLADMREWYRRKLKELARNTAERGIRIAELEAAAPAMPRLADTGGPDDEAATDLEPGDRQLGELLRSLELVDAETLAALWSEAGRQRRSLRQVLLASGAVTLYQLALIEAGNLDGLVLGRFRVIDRLRATPREAIYRVLDPTRLDARTGGVFLLRHLAEAEMQDAIHPDEFRQRFAAARNAPHPNLAGVVEVAEILGRPAVLLEWLAGLFSADWPNYAAHPGCWVRLLTMAAEGVDAAHRAGLVHGRFTSDAFVLSANGVLKVTGFGEPAWLAGVPVPVDASPGADLRALGQVAFGWSQLAMKKRSGTRQGRAFPAELIAIVRRLEADPEPPMADTVAADRPYESAAELVADLKRVARETPFSDDAWEKLLRYVSENSPEAPVAPRQSA